MDSFLGHIDQRTGSPVIFDTTGGTVRSYLQNKYPQDKHVTITISAHDKRRSTSQNRYYWMAIGNFIIPFLKETQGEAVSKMEVHAYHLTEILGCRFKAVSIMGNCYMVMEDIKTSEMTTREFDDFKDKLQLHWSEKGLDLPNPNEENLLNQII